jgi:hypothetical protein
MEITQSQNPKSDLLAIIAVISIFAIILGYMWLIDDYLTHKMTEICRNYSMEYYYHDTGSFYCMSVNGSIKMKEIQYS